ncbi:unnamed protein product, partial [Symbiodinium sp. KB8]
ELGATVLSVAKNSLQEHNLLWAPFVMWDFPKMRAAESLDSDEDRHYVLPRSLLRAGLGGWEMLVDGRAWRLMATGADVMLPGSNVSMNTETYLALRLEYAGAQIARYPATAYLACDSSEWKDGKTGMSQGGSRTVHGAVSVNFSCQEGGYRYPLEYEAATNFADCMEKEDGRNRWKASVRACICKYMSLEDAERTGY